ncbi:FAD-dependent oxidoreductase [Coriobacteriales bacterium OH1046]|nr:FAD-dependent oxidoreductase [Coriobacteriales bacterium OH1046]
MKYDVIIAGAGPSGCMAALAAARLGAKVLLIEKNAYPGGSNTAGMVCPLMTFHSGNKQIVRGIAQEVIDRLAEKGATLGHIPDPLGVTSTITPIEPSGLRLVYFEMLAQQPNITLLLHSFLYDAEMVSGTVTRVTVVGKDGTASYRAKTFIDATGDGDLAALCHVGFDKGRTSDGYTQPMSMIFKVGGIDFATVIAYIRQNPEQFILHKGYTQLEKYLVVSGFFDIVKLAKAHGDFNIPRDRILFFQGLHPGEAFINTSRIIKLSGISAQDQSIAEKEAAWQVEELMSFFQKYVPGFESCYLAAIADMSGVRESRRIHGICTLTVGDVYEERASDEGVAVCAFPIDIHDPAGADLQWMRRKQDFCYDIPYGVMVPRKTDNLLVTGRCISATHEALASARISATAMALGQAAGTAAYLALIQKVGFERLDVALLQQELRRQGAIPTKVDLR